MANKKAIVSLLGSKGGTGKTTLSHALINGLAGCDVASLLITTEPDTIDYPENRSYAIFQADTIELLMQLIAQFRATDFGRDAVLVIDGQARNHDLDSLLYAESDLSYVPYILARGSDEALYRLSLDLNLFPKAFALGNAWPTTRMEAHYLEAVLEAKGLLDDTYLGRIVEPIRRIPSLSEVTALEFDPAALSVEARKECRRLANKTLELLNWGPE